MNPFHPAIYACLVEGLPAYLAIDDVEDRGKWLSIKQQEMWRDFGQAELKGYSFQDICKAIKNWYRNQRAWPGQLQGENHHQDGRSESEESGQVKKPYKGVQLSKWPAVKACLEEGLPTYQAFLAKRKTVEKKAWVEKKQEEIVITFGGKELKAYKAEDIRKAVKNWYNNWRKHSCGSNGRENGRENDDSEEEEVEVDDMTSNNPFVKMLSGRAKTSWRHWWQVSEAPEIQEAFAAMEGSSIGERAQRVKALFEELSEEDQAEWARKASEASKLPIDQCFMCVLRFSLGRVDEFETGFSNQGGFHVLLTNMLASVIGLGPLQIGMAAFHVVWGCKDKKNKLHTHEMSITKDGKGISLAFFEGGPSAQEKERMDRWFQEVILDNPTVDGGATCDKRGQVILPECNFKSTLEESTSVLKAYLTETWRVQRPEAGELDLDALVESPSEYVDPAWTELFKFGWGAKNAPGAIMTLYSGLWSAQEAGSPFKFLGASDLLPMRRVTVLSTPRKDKHRSRTTPAATPLRSVMSVSELASSPSRATTPLHMPSPFLPDIPDMDQYEEDEMPPSSPSNTIHMLSDPAATGGNHADTAAMPRNEGAEASRRRSVAKGLAQRVSREWTRLWEMKEMSREVGCTGRWMVRAEEVPPVGAQDEAERAGVDEGVGVDERAGMDAVEVHR
ncbi:hypothetical protein C8T65DRAFT_739450 [Cerioporus squamosus]|nr:hypothetical protein C8T65DRAFT_739450 [Cerioporus squamosus]